MPYGYITKLPDSVERTHVRYNNRYGIAIAAVNKHPSEAQTIRIPLEKMSTVTLYRCCGNSPDSYNDVDRNEVFIETLPMGEVEQFAEIELAPHSVNIIQIL